MSSNKKNKFYDIESLPNEKWVIAKVKYDLPYQIAVSSLGRAQLFEETIHFGRIINSNITKTGIYLYLIKKSDGTKLVKNVRLNFPKLIQEAFGLFPECKYFQHKDGDKKNNAISNLEFSRFKLVSTATKKKNLSIKLESTEKVAIFYMDEDAERNYAVTNYGRAFVYYKDYQDGRMLSLMDTKGRPMVSFTPSDGKRRSWLLHKLVAMYFIPKPLPDQIYIIHKDHDPKNCLFTNLLWATQKDKDKHTLEKQIKLGLGNKAKQVGQKLNATQVIHIKRLIQRGKMRNKMIAKQFGISEMAVYRIKRGENWGHLTIDNL